MVQINFARKEINCKIVYYGPGLSGKTTNLEKVHESAPQANKGELTSISTDGDRTLFFDFMPLDLGTIAGMRTKFHIYTVPGQVYYNSTRKLVLLGADGVIFVADSSPGAMESNKQSLENLKDNLLEMGKDVAKMPLVIQFNKRDMEGAISVKEMERELNIYGVPTFEAVASKGEGVISTLKAISKLVLESINSSERAVGATAPLPAEASKSAGPVPPVPSDRRTPEPKAAPAPAASSAAASDSPVIERNYVPPPVVVQDRGGRIPAREEHISAASSRKAQPADAPSLAVDDEAAVINATATATLPSSGPAAPAHRPAPAARRPVPQKSSWESERSSQRVSNQEKVNTLLRNERPGRDSAPAAPRPGPARKTQVIGGKPKAKRGGPGALIMVVGAVILLVAAAAAYLLMV